MDRQLTVEFPWLLKETFFTPPTGTNWVDTYTTDTRELTNQIYVQESKLDLSGYVQSDLTVGFRRSFEQKSVTEFLILFTYELTTVFI